MRRNDLGKISFEALIKYRMYLLENNSEKTIDIYALKAYNIDMKGDEQHEAGRLDCTVGKNGWRLKRNGAGHDIYTNGKECETVPRHRELNENLAKAIIKRRGLR